MSRARGEYARGMDYDDQNVFAKILRGEIPCDKVYEDEHALAFRDINPQTLDFSQLLAVYPAILDSILY